MSDTSHILIHILWLWKTGLREKLWNCSPLFFENVFRLSCLQVTWISSCRLMSFSSKVDPFSEVEITVQELISIHMVAKGWRGDLSSGNLTSETLLLTSRLQLHYFMAKEIEMALLTQGHLAPVLEQLKLRASCSHSLRPGPLRDRSLSIVVYAKQSIGGVKNASLLRSILGWSWEDIIIRNLPSWDDNLVWQIML